MTKPVIIKRITKGAALTYAEQDANFQNLQDATVSITGGATAVSADLNGNITLVAGTNVTITGNNTTKTITINSTAPPSGLINVVEDTTPQLGGDLDVNGKKLTSVSNGDISLYPNGTGKVNLQCDKIVLGDGLGTVNIDTLSNETLNIRTLTAPTWIQLDSTGIDLFATPTGAVNIGGPGAILSGYGGTSKLTTNSNSTNLRISTNNESSPSNQIYLEAGTNGSIILACHGTGKVYLNSPAVLPSLTTSARDLLGAVEGMMVYNATVDKFQGYANGVWVDLH